MEQSFCDPPLKPDEMRHRTKIRDTMGSISSDRSGTEPGAQSGFPTFLDGPTMSESGFEDQHPEITGKGHQEIEERKSQRLEDEKKEKK